MARQQDRRRDQAHHQQLKGELRLEQRAALRDGLGGDEIALVAVGMP